MLLSTIQDIIKFLTPQHDFLETVVSLIVIISALYALFVFVAKPIWNIFFKSSWDNIINFIKRANGVPEQLEKALGILDTEVLPFIKSFQYEFSKNSGKSIKDQITRIDDNVKLAELRSKLVSNMLLSTGAYECNPSGICIWVNKALCDLFGLTNEEMLSNGWLSAIDEKEREHVWEQWTNSIKKSIPYECEYTVNNRVTNETFRVRTTAMAHKSVDSRVLGYYGTVIRLK